MSKKLSQIIKHKELSAIEAFNYLIDNNIDNIIVSNENFNDTVKNLNHLLYWKFVGIRHEHEQTLFLGTYSIHNTTFRYCYYMEIVDFELTRDQIAAFIELYPHINYIAMDMNGKAYMFKNEPKYNESFNEWNFTGNCYDEKRIKLFDNYTTKTNSRNSLIKLSKYK